MATSFSNAAGEYQIQFTGLDGKRKSLWLGKRDADSVDEFRLRVDRLIKSARDGRPPDTVTQAWLNALPVKDRQRLEAKGLISDSPVATVGQLCDYSIARADVSESTLQKYHDAKANLLAYFGDQRGIFQITAGDAAEFAAWLRKSGRRPKPGPLKPTTVVKRIEQCKFYFAVAVKKRWLADNPFDSVKVQAESPTDRLYNVDRETIEKVMDAADPELRLIIALARFLGLRTPSETWPLEWGWINWGEGVIRVLDSKRKRFEAKKWRFPPLFPEVQELLGEAFNSPNADPVYIFKPTTITATALRNRLERACLRAGVLPWPKLWQNMRSTRETELVDQGYPLHVVSAWIGNSPDVALRHYLQVFKEHSNRALGADRSGLQRWADLARKTSAKNLCTPHGSASVMTHPDSLVTHKSGSLNHFDAP
jgi:integrase